jgi:sec-independent protein translocase protein TatA
VSDQAPLGVEIVGAEGTGPERSCSAGTVCLMVGGPQLIIILVVVLVLFGGSQLPKLARNLGKAQQEFKAGLGEGEGSSDAVAPPPSASTKSFPPPPAPPQ